MTRVRTASYTIDHISSQRRASNFVSLEQQHPARDCYLWLKKTAFQQHQCLPFELVDQLSQAHADILISVTLLIQDPSTLLICKTFLESPQNFGICELTLGEPRLCHNAESFAQHAKELGSVGNDHNSLLNSRACDFGWSIDEFRGVELSST